MLRKVLSLFCWQLMRKSFGQLFSSASLQTKIHNLSFEDRKRALLRTLREDVCNNPTFHFFFHSPGTIFSPGNKWYHLLLQPSQATGAVPSVGALSAVGLASGLRGAWYQEIPGAEQRTWRGAQFLGQALSCVWVVQGM